MERGSTDKLMIRLLICVLIFAQFLVPAINASTEKPPTSGETDSNSSGQYIIIGLAVVAAVFIGYRILKRDGKEKGDNEDEAENEESSEKGGALYDRKMAPFRTAVVSDCYQPRIPLRFYFNIKNIPAQKEPDPRLNLVSGREIQIGLTYGF